MNFMKVDIREAVEHVWIDILGSTEGSWEDAGGDSMALLRCVSELEALLGKHLEMEAFTFDMNTEDMVNVISTGRKPQDETRPALVLLPGTMGYGPGLAAFGSKLGKVARVIPIHYPGLDSVLAGHGSIDDMAASALEQIRHEQPSGDIRLLGYSFGGGVAFKVAHQLIAEGRSIKFIGILDTNAAPRVTNQRKTIIHMLQRIRAHEVTAYRMACRAVAKAVVSFGLQVPFCRFMDAKIWQHFADTHFIFKIEIEELLRMQAFGEWVAGPREPLPVTGTVFVSNRPGLSPHLGWRPLFAQLDIISVSGGHLNLVSEPHLTLNLIRIEQAFASSLVSKEELLG